MGSCANLYGVATRERNDLVSAHFHIAVLLYIFYILFHLISFYLLVYIEFLNILILLLFLINFLRFWEYILFIILFWLYYANWFIMTSAILFYSVLSSAAVRVIFLCNYRNLSIHLHIYLPLTELSLSKWLSICLSLRLIFLLTMLWPW